MMKKKPNVPSKGDTQPTTPREIHCSQLGDIDMKGDYGSKLNLPRFGIPFGVKEALFFIPRAPAIAKKVQDNQVHDKQLGPMEARAGLPKTSVCRRQYKKSNPLIQPLFAMCVGLVNQSNAETYTVADLVKQRCYAKGIQRSFMF